MQGARPRGSSRPHQDVRASRTSSADGQLHALPAASVLGIPTTWGPFVRTRSSRGPASCEWAWSYRPARRDGDDESIGSFMERRFGTEANEYLAEPLLAGIHAGDVDRLSLGALFPRFADVERTYGSLLRGFRKGQLSRPKPGSGDRDGRRVSIASRRAERSRPRAGPDAAAGVNTAARRRSRHRELQRIDGIAWRPRRQTFPPMPSSSPRRPTRPLASSLNLDADRGLCDQVPYASTATVALAFRRDAIADPLNGSGFVVPRVERTGILAASWLSSKWPGRAPDDRVLMRTFIGGARDPEGLERDDNELVATRSTRCVR